MTLLPAACFAAMSALNSSTVYPPSPALSRLNVMPPGFDASASANATAIRSYAAGTSAIFCTVAPLLKFCQYPVSTWAGSAAGGFVPPSDVVPDTAAPYGEQLPLGSHARTLNE